jgi:hypothetical protein
LFQLITPSQLAQVAREALRAVQDQLRATIQFFLRIPQRAAAVVEDVLAHRFTHQTPVDRAAAVVGRAALAVRLETLRALLHRKATPAGMAMVQHFGKARVAAVRVRLVSMQRL